MSATDTPTLDSLREHSNSALLFECVSGSRAYGTSTSESDVDLRGIFALPVEAYLRLAGPPAQIADERSNTVYLSLRRTIELLAAANPSVLELLYMPADCVRWITPAWEAVITRRDQFISRRCVETHIGYAQTQIKKARGQNKWVNQPKAEQPPRKEDYCHVIAANSLLPGDAAPCRPMSLPEAGVNLAEFHAARLEHAPGVFRLYHYGRAALGVFRGEAIACVSIPLEDDIGRFAGLLIYNEPAWRQASADHANYWTWRRERNESRWRQQERGEIDYDAKNLMHTVRLLLSGEAILLHGQPMIRFEGAQQKLLMDIRQGRFEYDEVLSMAGDIAARCEKRLASSHLPETASLTFAEMLLQEITSNWQIENER